MYGMIHKTMGTIAVQYMAIALSTNFYERVIVGVINANSLQWVATSPIGHPLG